MTTYKIIQFQGSKQVIERGLTFDQAQAHCRREDTRGNGKNGPWFDGYESE